MAISYGYGTAGTGKKLGGGIMTACYVKRAWSDNWTYIPYLYCLNAEEAAMPSVGRARLRFDYGWIKREGANFFAGWTPLNISGCYVCVRAFMGRTVFTGVIDYEKHTPHGTVGWFQGPQEFNAFSIAHLVDRVQICGAHTETGYVDTPLKFNERAGRGASLTGNRSQDIGPDGCYVYGTGATWSSFDVLNYILTYHMPDGIPFLLRYGAIGLVLNQTFESYDFNGQSALAALNRLLDRRRGIGASMWSDGGGYAYLDLYSLLVSPVTVGGYTVPSNDDQSIVSMDGRLDLQPEITLNNLATFDSVWVRGGPVYSTFSVSIADGTLEPAWTEEQETAYSEGSQAEDADSNAHDAERKTDKFDAVYQHFRIPADWDWTAGDGGGPSTPEGGGDPQLTTNPVVPQMMWESSMSFDAVGPFWTPGHTLEKETALAKDDTAENTEYRPAFVVAIDPDTDIYNYVDAMDAVEKTSASIRVLDNGMAINVSPRKVNHVGALNHFAIENDTAVDPEYDYETYIATVNVKTDAHLCVKAWLPGVPITETGRTKVIEYPSAEAWVILPGTVKDIQDGELVRAADYEVVRDDSNTLRVIAALAAAWYMQPRSDLAIRMQGVSLAYPVGSMIRGYASNWTLTAVGSVITARGWDFSDRVPVTWWRTGYTEMDAADIPSGRAKGRRK